MVTIASDLYVIVNEMQGDRAPQPRPLANGFSGDCAYRVLGLHSPSETGEAYFILANDRDEIWFISNRHLRAYGLFPGLTTMRFPADREQPSRALRIAHGDMDNRTKTLKMRAPKLHKHLRNLKLDAR